MARSIKIALDASSAAFIADMDKSIKSVFNFKAILTETSSIGEKFLEGLGIGSGIAAAEKGFDLLKEGVESVKHAFEGIGEMGRGATRLGMTVEEFSRLKYAADLSHVSIEQVETDMSKMEAAVAKAAEGDKALSATFQRLGLDAKALMQLNPSQEFEQISEAIARVRNSSQRMEEVREIFGRAGSAILPMIENLRSLEAESDRVGFTRTAEQVKAVEDAEQEWARVTKDVETAMMDLAVKATPEIIHLGEAVKTLTDGVKNNIQEAEGIMTSSFAHLANTLEYVRNDSLYTAQAILDIGMGMDTVADAIPAFANLVTFGLVKSLNDFVGSMHAAHDHMETLHDDIQKTLDASHGGPSWGDELTKSLSGASDGARDLNSESGRTFTAMRDGAESATAAVEKLHKATKDTGDALDKMYDDIDKKIHQFGMGEHEKNIEKLQELKNPHQRSPYGSDMQETIKYYDFEKERDAAIQGEKQLEAMEKQKQAQREGEEAAKRHAEGLDRELDAHRRLVEDPAQRRFEDQLKIENDLLREGKITAEQYADALAKAQAELDKAQQREMSHGGGGGRAMSYREPDQHIDSQRQFDFRLLPNSRGGGEDKVGQEQANQNIAQLLDYVQKMWNQYTSPIQQGMVLEIK